MLGTLLSAAGFALAGLSGGLVGLCASLALAGAGGSTQHPLASAAVSRAYGERARGPLGTYNFAGDLGKATLPPAVSLLLTMMVWRSALWVVAGLGTLVAVLIRWLMPLVPAPPVTVETVTAPDHEAAGKGGFGLLFAIGVLDSAARMGFLLFLPFLLKAKGASLTTVGLALSLVFIGGAFGKAACGWLGARLGLLATVVTTEVGTAAAILTVLALPLATEPGLAAALGGDAQRHVLSALRHGPRTCERLNGSSEPSLCSTPARWDQARWRPCSTGGLVMQRGRSGLPLRQP